MDPMNLATRLRSEAFVNEARFDVVLCVRDHRTRFGTSPSQDLVLAWTFARILEEARTLPASSGRDWILDRWPRIAWPSLHAQMVKPQTECGGQPVVFLAWHLAQVLELVCHPRVSPEGVLMWLRTRAASELHYARTRIAETDEAFTAVPFDDAVDRRLVREVFLPRIAEAVRCLCWIDKEPCRRWLAFLRSDDTCELALRITQSSTVSAPLFPMLNIHDLVIWVAKCFEALIRPGGVLVEPHGESVSREGSGAE